MNPPPTDPSRPPARAGLPPGPPPGHRVPSSQRSRSRYGAAAATLAAAALLTAGCSSGHTPPSASRPAPTTVAPPSSTTEPPPQYSPSPYSWVRSASPALSVGGGAGTTLATVIAPEVGQSWLAVGTRLSPAGVPTATAWTSSDGVHWKATAVDPGGVPSSALAAAEYRGQTVVVGSVGAGANRQAAAWLSAKPGEPFTPVEVPLSSGPSTMTLVAVGALGMFATGTVDGRFAVWSSTDGHHWGEQPAAEKTITSATGARVLALLAEGDKVYAAGSVGSGAHRSAALWATTDSIHWHPVTTASDQFSGPGQRVIYSLAPLQNGVVAVGAVNRGTGWVPASWVSPDGASWSPPFTDFPGAPAPAGGLAGSSGGWAARSVSAVPTFSGSTSLVAAGGGPSGQAAWRSTDGLHWEPVTLPAGTAGASGWRATIAAATTDTTVIADGQAGQAHLVTDTSAGWKQPSADPAVFGPVRPTALPVSLQPSAGRLLLTVRLTTAPQAIGPAAVTYTTLTSADGTDWAPAGAATAGPATVPTAGALTVSLPGRWVAVGEPASGRPEAWISSDGHTWTPVGLLGTGGTATGTGGATRGSSTATTAPAGSDLPARVNGVCAGTPTASTPTAGTPTAGTPTAGTPTAGTPTAGTATADTSTTSTTGTGSGSTRGAAGTAARAQTVVAVGSSLQPPTPATSSSSSSSSALPARGHGAVAWYSTGGTAWKRATVSPEPPSGAIESMSGCLRTGSGLVAWGSSTTAGGASVPALWRSPTGAAWTRVDNVTAFTSSLPSPLTDLAAAGRDWLAVADPNPAAGPQPGPAGSGPAPGPAASAASSGATGPAATFEDGRDAIWLSPNGGSSWQSVDTFTPPWLGTEGSQADVVAFAGATPVLAGSVDGRVAVWTGTAVATGKGPGTGSSPSSG